MHPVVHQYRFTHERPNDTRLVLAVFKGAFADQVEAWNILGARLERVRTPFAGGDPDDAPVSVLTTVALIRSGYLEPAFDTLPDRLDGAYKEAVRATNMTLEGFGSATLPFAQFKWPSPPEAQPV